MFSEKSYKKLFKLLLICHDFSHILCSSRKYPYPPPWKGFALCPPHPSRNVNLASYFALKVWAFENPHPPWDFWLQSLL